MSRPRYSHQFKIEAVKQVTEQGHLLARVLLDQIDQADRSPAPVASRTELDAPFIDGPSLGPAGSC